MKKQGKEEISYAIRCRIKSSLKCSWTIERRKASTWNIQCCWVTIPPTRERYHTSGIVDFELRSAKASLESLGTEEQATLVDKVGGFACLVLALGHGGSRVKDRKDAEYIPERDHLRYRNWEAGLKLVRTWAWNPFICRFPPPQGHLSNDRGGIQTIQVNDIS
ncbi:hypothetical protein FRC14_006353 [Serendipita sp. 396]|nr:hypothetical protein FRC14_006353 [Serendipita sp. 396]